MAAMQPPPGSSTGRHVGASIKPFLPMIIMIVVAIGGLALEEFAPALSRLGCPSALPPLNLPGAMRLTVPPPCFIDFRNQCPGFVDLLAPYSAHSDAGASGQMLLSLDGTFYVIGESQQPHPLQLPNACAGVVALTQDGTWMACVQGASDCIDCFTACTSCFGSSIVAVSLVTATLGNSRELLPYAPGLQFGVLSWSPDGHHLVVVRQVVGNETSAAPVCSLAFYWGSTPDAATVPTGRISLADEDLCRAAQVLWSPDGSKIAVTLRADRNQPFEIVVISTSVLSPAALFPTANGITEQMLTIAPLLTIPNATIDENPFHALPHIAWTPDGRLLTASIGFGYQLVAVDLASGVFSQVLTIPADASPIQTFSWTPDGRRIVFAIGHYGTEHCSSPPDSVYMVEAPIPV